MIFNTTLQDQVITMDISTLPGTQSPPKHFGSGGHGHKGKGVGQVGVGVGPGAINMKYKFIINTYSNVSRQEISHRST